MPRVKRGVTAHRRHKKVLKAAKGYYGARSRVYRVAKQAVTKAGQYAYRDRKVKKRMFRGLWIQRINAACRRRHGDRWTEVQRDVVYTTCWRTPHGLSLPQTAN